MFNFKMEDLLKKTEGMKGLFEEKMKERSAKMFVGEAGAGSVRITLNGLFDCVAVEIDEGLLKKEVKAEVQQLIQGAINVASQKVREDFKTDLQQSMGFLGRFMPGLKLE